ncbi:unnamed protein product [Allacma fusca]|uniref:Uncharacterized protein n=1 Tax=Allacma fusca TaxID=39272 RepID=A0A8J2JXN9_9HEXA|nr:unnamed protein product [Allacma fusca]
MKGALLYGCFLLLIVLATLTVTEGLYRTVKPDSLHKKDPEVLYPPGKYIFVGTVDHKRKGRDVPQVFE